MPDPTTDSDPLDFDAVALAKAARARVAADHRTRAQEYRDRAAAEAAFEAEMERRAEEAHVKLAARRKETEDAREAEVARTLATPPAELAAEVVARIRRR